MVATALWIVAGILVVVLVSVLVMRCFCGVASVTGASAVGRVPAGPPRPPRHPNGPTRQNAGVKVA